MKAAIALGAALCIAFNVQAASPEIPAGNVSDTASPLRFYNLHNHENLTLHHRRGQNVSEAANIFMRDWRRGEQASMDSSLLDLLLDLQTAIKQHDPQMSVTFHVISGYRSPSTNENLRAKGGAQAKKSLHMQGQAIDIRVPGLSTEKLRDIASCLPGSGGVGYYEQDGFVHIDVGSKRYWPSRDYLKNLPCNA